MISLVSHDSAAIANRGDKLVALLLVVGMILAHFGASAQSVSIVDPHLEAAVRETLGQPDGVLTISDMQRLVLLEAPGRGITSLDGFVGANFLVELDLSFNSLTDVTLPTGLTNLSLLRLQGNQLRQFAFPEPLPNLHRLELGENQLADVCFLTNVTGLTWLELPYNDLTAFGLEKDLPQLEWLDLGYNRVRNMAFLARLPQLAGLILDDNGLTNFTPPGPLEHLKLLSFVVNRISDLSFLSFTPNLESLDLAANFAASFSFPESIPNLNWLNLGENRLTNVFFAPNLTNLLSLWLDDNRFISIPSIRQLTGLRLLDVGINQISELTIPHTATNLLVLQVRLNPLRTLILSDVLATNHLADTVQSLRDAGVTVHVYPLSPTLTIRESELGGMRRIELRGPPGIHDVMQSENLLTWHVEWQVTNTFGETSWSLVPVRESSFYRTRLP